MSEKNDPPNSGDDNPDALNPWAGVDDAGKAADPARPSSSKASAGAQDGASKPAPKLPGSPWLPDSAEDDAAAKGQRKRLPPLDGLRNLGGPLTGGKADGAPAGASAPGNYMWLWVVLAAVASWPAFTSFHRVGEAEAGVVQRLGRVDRTMGPGIAVTWPAPFETLQRVVVDEGPAVEFAGKPGGQALVTADGTLVDVVWTVQWHVASPRAYLSGVDSAEGAIRSLGAAAMTRAIGALTYDDAVRVNRDRLAAQIYAALQPQLKAYGSGIVIDSINIANIQPPGAISSETAKVESAREDARKLIADAEKEAESLRDNARKEAADFDEVYAQYEAAPDVTRTRIYYETMERILRRADLSIAPAGTVPPPSRAGAASPPAAVAGQAAAKSGEVQ